VDGSPRMEASFMPLERGFVQMGARARTQAPPFCISADSLTYKHAQRHCAPTLSSCSCSCAPRARACCSCASRPATCSRSSLSTSACAVAAACCSCSSPARRDDSACASCEWCKRGAGACLITLTVAFVKRKHTEGAPEGAKEVWAPEGWQGPRHFGSSQCCFCWLRFTGGWAMWVAYPGLLRSSTSTRLNMGLCLACAHITQGPRALICHMWL